MYFQKKRCIAMLLAGGQGSRLKVLTENTAKPAVPFGGKYRIIDFPLSNCVNSGIDTVGILTQYQPLELNEYIGNGQPWGLNKTIAALRSCPPMSATTRRAAGIRALPTRSIKTSTSLTAISPIMWSFCPVTTSIRWIMPPWSHTTRKTTLPAPSPCVPFL